MASAQHDLEIIISAIDSLPRRYLTGEIVSLREACESKLGTYYSLEKYWRATSRPLTRKALAVLFPEEYQTLVKEVNTDIEKSQDAIQRWKEIRVSHTGGTSRDELNRYFIDDAIDELGQTISRLKDERAWIRGLALMPKLSNRLTERDIDDARSRSLLELLPTNDIRRFGDKWITRCPFHEERTGSFVIFPDNHYHCFGCSAHGDAIEFIMRRDNVKFPDAVRLLTARS